MDIETRLTAIEDIRDEVLKYFFMKEKLQLVKLTNHYWMLSDTNKNAGQYCYWKLEKPKYPLAEEYWDNVRKVVCLGVVSKIITKGRYTMVVVEGNRDEEEHYACVFRNDMRY